MWQEQQTVSLTMCACNKKGMVYTRWINPILPTNRTNWGPHNKISLKKYNTKYQHSSLPWKEKIFLHIRYTCSGNLLSRMLCSAVVMRLHWPFNGYINFCSFSSFSSSFSLFLIWYEPTCNRTLPWKKEKWKGETSTKGWHELCYVTSILLQENI